MPQRAAKRLPIAPATELLSLCKAAADSLRLDILRVLSVDSFAVMELAHIFSMQQPGVSHHLKILSAAGLLATRREGNSIFYRRALVPAGHNLAELQQELYTAVDRIEIATEMAHRIVAVHRERAEHSMEFFRRNAERFQQHQEQIARFDQYGKSVEDLIASEQLDPQGTGLEVGPGEGELLLLLTRLFSHVIALDNSPEMLARARRSLSSRKQGNIRFIEGELSDAVDEKLKVDLLILNMVLHHMASPARVFEEGRQLLAPNSALVIIDLCPHDQDWVRDSCGDLWLGFDPDDLALWANRAGLVRAQSSYLALRNGFQIQMQLFHDARALAQHPLSQDTAVVA